jgi:3-oxoacyl-[acyl-carrier-protein] synthase-3
MEENVDFNELYPFPIRIAGIGKYIPERALPSSQLEEECGLPNGWCVEHFGIHERCWVDGETQSVMGAKAAGEAIADAGLDPWDIDFIINASLTFERKIPDGGPMIHRRLGLMDSGIPATTIHAGGQSFPAALDMCMSLLAAGGYHNILIVCSEVISAVLDPAFPQGYCLFGDGAAAVVVGVTPEGEPSCVENLLLETYGRGVEHLHCKYGYTAFVEKAEKAADLAVRLDMDPFIKEGSKYVEKNLDTLLAHQNKEIDLVIPQPVGMPFIDQIAERFPGKSFLANRDLGFCGAASYPLALYEAVKSGRLKRGSRFLLTGFSSGLSVGGAVLVY